jgi:hypothetical protein
LPNRPAILINPPGDRQQQNHRHDPPNPPPPPKWGSGGIIELGCFGGRHPLRLTQIQGRSCVRQSSLFLRLCVTHVSILPYNSRHR